MRRVIILGTISVLLMNTVIAEESINVNSQETPEKKESMVFGDYRLRPKAEITEEAIDKIEVPEATKATEATAAVEVTEVTEVTETTETSTTTETVEEVKPTETTPTSEVSEGVQTIKLDIPMSEPSINNNPGIIKPARPATYDIGNYEEGMPALNKYIKKDENPSVPQTTQDTVYRSEKELLQAKEMPNPNPDTDEERFTAQEELEENEYIINLDMSDEQLFKPKIAPKKVIPNKIDLEKKPIFNIPSQNRGTNIIEEKIALRQMKGDIPSTKEYKLNQQFTAKHIYTKNHDTESYPKEEVILTLHQSDKMDLALKGHPHKCKDSAMPHTHDNVGLVFRF